MYEIVIRIMMEAGAKGISLRKLVLHVYNDSNTLFSAISKKEVQQYVYNLVRNHSSRPTDPFKKIGWGRYCLNPKNERVKQTVIDWEKKEESQEGAFPTVHDQPSSPTFF